MQTTQLQAALARPRRAAASRASSGCVLRARASAVRSAHRAVRWQGPGRAPLLRSLAARKPPFTPQRSRHARRARSRRLAWPGAPQAPGPFGRHPPRAEIPAVWPLSALAARPRRAALRADARRPGCRSQPVARYQLRLGRHSAWAQPRLRPAARCSSPPSRRCVICWGCAQAQA